MEQEQQVIEIKNLWKGEKVVGVLLRKFVDRVKGNSSEVARIAGKDIQTKGVDAVEHTNSRTNLGKIAKTLANARDLTVVITGKEDIIVDKDNCYYINNGCDMMANVVGTGCMATSVIGTFAAVCKDSGLAAAAGLCCYEIAAELAVRKTNGPASFKQELFDCIFNLKQDDVSKMKKVENERILLHN